MELRTAKQQANLCEWRQMVYECRGSGMTVTQWCKAHQILPKTYYYRQHQVWKTESSGKSDITASCGSALPAATFAEVQIPPPQRGNPISEAAAITIRRGKLVCEIRNGTDPELLRQILRLVNEHA